MNWTLRLVEAAIRRLKQDPGYRIRTSYGARDLFAITRFRGYQGLRGLYLRVRVGRAGWPLFCGRRVVVEHAYRFSCGRSCILEDGVFMSALGERGVRFGHNVTVGKYSIIQCTGVVARVGVGLEVGDRSAIGAQSYIGAQGGVQIGNDVIMGPGVRVFSENHVFLDSNVPIRVQGESRIGVVIEDDCWIGAGSTVLDGVVVGRGSVVAAGAVVTNTVPEYSVVAGVPARVLSDRRKK